MTAIVERKPGHDGADWQVEAVRDFAGHGKRDLVRRIKYDVVMRLHSYSPPLISLEQRDAAIRLQCDDQLSRSPVMASSATMGVSRADSDFGIHQAILDATGRVRVCRSVVGHLWPLVESIVLNNLNVSMTAKRFDISQGFVVPYLRKGLDAVAMFYEHSKS